MTTIDYNRRNLLLTTSKVGEVVPSYFEVDNSKLISFLEKYYDYLDSNQADGFGDKIKRLIHARDARENTTNALDLIVEEIGNGIKASSFFQQPRLMVKLLGDFYRAKGSLNSAEGFFKGFFGEDATIEYPKQKIFTLANSSDSDVSAGTINGSLIGYESQKFLTNNELYQTFSILIKCGISTADYENLYKRFVHPAGFFFAGEVLTVSEGILTTSALGLDPLDSDEPITLFNEAFTLATAQTLPLTAFYDSGGDVDAFRVRTDQFISDFNPATTTLTRWGKFYGAIDSIATPNSFTFDDSDRPASQDSGGHDMSMTFETMDNEIFTTYLSDSAY